MKMVVTRKPWRKGNGKQMTTTISGIKLVIVTYRQRVESITFDGKKAPISSQLWYKQIKRGSKEPTVWWVHGKHEHEIDYD